MITLLAFLYGTLLGSFFNVCVFRLPRGTSIVFPRSACPVCKSLIHGWQNIPILSYLWLRGKCASCGSRISLRYPAVELVSGLLIAFVWRTDGPSLIAGWSVGGFDAFKAVALFAEDLVFVSLLIIITLIDWDHQLILDGTSYFGIAVGLLASALRHQFIPALLAGAGGMLFFYAVRVVGEFVFLREAMGEGDVKLAGMLGAFLGPERTAIAILLSFPIGILLAGGLIVLGLKGRKDYIPFGPAMALGGFISAFWGMQLLDWYLRFRLGY